MKTSPRIFRSAGLVGIGTFASRILGLIREILMAATFGTAGVASAFFVAFTIPNLFRRLFGEGALSAAFVPHYVHLRDGESPAAAARTTRAVARWLVRWLGTLSLAGIVLASLALRLPELADSTRTTLLCLRILMPYVIGICLAALMMGVLNAHRRYALPAFTPCLLNLIWIGALVALQGHDDWVPEEKILWVARAILVAGFVQFAVQAVAAFRIMPTPARTRGPDPGLAVVLRRMAPAALGAAVTQVNVLADRLLAFWAGGYGPAALAYSERLVYLPLGLFATALGTILLPEFSSLVQRRDREELGRTLDRVLRGLTFLMLPAAAGLGVLAEPIVRLVYERGEFDAASTALTARALALYAPGLLVFSLAKIFVPLFHAHGDTRTPMRVGAGAVGINLGLNLLFLWTFPAGWKHAGLAAGTVISVLLQVAVLSRLTHRRFAPLRLRSLGASLLRHIACCIPMVLVALGFLRGFPDLPLLLQVPGAIVLAALTYGGSAFVLRCPELRELARH